MYFVDFCGQYRHDRASEARGWNTKLNVQCACDGSYCYTHFASKMHQYLPLAALKFCFKTCVAIKFVDDDDDDDDDFQILKTKNFSGEAHNR